MLLSLIPPRNALVTGASSGLGRELTRLLVTQRRMTVLATARRLDRLEALRDEFPEGSVRILDGDLADPGFRERLWQVAEALPGGLDLLVNNAGIGHYSDFAEIDPAIVDKILAINVLAVFDLTRRAAQAMRLRGRGQILEISSVLGEFSIAYSATYCASKHAVNGLVKSLSDELSGTGVTIQAACPGRFASEFRHQSLSRRDAPAKPFGGEPVERVAQGIIRGLDRRSTFIYPTWQAWATVMASRWLRGPFGLLMRSWGKRQFGREMGKEGPARSMD